MTENNESYGVHWFRRDLRIAGNPALQWSWKEHKGRVLGLFTFDKIFLARPDFSHNRFGLFLASLRALRDELRQAGGDLLVLDQGPDQAFEQLFSTLQQARLPLPSTISFNRDYEPFARIRDQRMYDLLTKRFGLAVHTERDHLLIEPAEITKPGEQSSYQVYSPFAKRWFETMRSPEVQARVAAQKKAVRQYETRLEQKTSEPLFALSWKRIFKNAECLQDHLDAYIEHNRPAVSVPLPAAGHAAALAIVRAFKKRVEQYQDRRDFPAIEGTSRLSVYLKNGSITSAQVIAELGLEQEAFGNKTGRSTFLKEIVWREFYYHILFHHPRVEHEAFLQKYKNLDWENREDYFERWKSGTTGFPIVDAGMRELNTTGWMHNRVRMIVASFLTKDLLIGWQWGEKYFMEKLLDGDLAPNNGGWQWAASTGCDPQPYFRIFNPLLQSQKFDPEGEYIRRFVPELRMLDAKRIHEPSTSGVKVNYPSPLVDHREQKEKALALYDA